MAEKVNYNAMDVAKFLSAVLLVCAHTASERVSLPRVLDLCCSLYIVTVPFFFIASSFLFFKKLDTQANEERTTSYKKYTARIWEMYFAWSLIYFCFVVAKWIMNGSGIDEVVIYFHSALVFSTYPTIWFLPALWIGVSLVYLCRYKWKFTDGQILLTALLLYCIGAMGYSYHSLTPLTESLNDAYISVFVTWRNGLFNAFIYAFIGYKIVTGKTSLKYNMLGVVVFGVAFLVEAFAMKRVVPSADANFLFMLVPFSSCFFSSVSQIKLPDSKVYVPMRKMSMLIFVSQRLFLTAIPSVIATGVISGPWDITENGVLALLMVVAEVCLFSFLLMVGSKRVKIIKYLM